MKGKPAPSIYYGDIRLTSFSTVRLLILGITSCRVHSLIAHSEVGILVANVFYVRL